MTLSLIKALENLNVMAAPAPWLVRYLGDDASSGATAIITAPAGEAADDDFPDEAVVAACPITAPASAIPADRRRGRNAELIVELRNALPDLLRLARLGLAAERGPRITER